jgi:ATP-dependent NAD(P)H-hydrate dehydratase
MSDMPILSQSTKELLGKVRMIVPPMLEKFYKGQLGRVAVIGGSEKCVFAPSSYFPTGIMD